MRWIRCPSIGRDRLLELVEPASGRPPVEPVEPVGDELLQVPEVGAGLPSRARDRVREAGAAEPVPEVGQHLVGTSTRKGSKVAMAGA